MKKSFIFLLITLFVLINASLFVELSNLSPDNTVYIPNQENDYAVIKTQHGAFPVSISATKKIDDGTELSIILINPVNIYFAEAEFLAQTTYTPSRVTIDIVPGMNVLKIKVPFIERGELIKISLNMDKIYFK